MSWPDWTFTTLWAALWAGGTLVILWALFADRARGRPRCDRCRYSLDGLDLPAPCPECGRPICSPRQALKTRRRWLPALLGLILVLAAPVAWRVPEARHRAALASRTGLVAAALIPGPALLLMAWLDSGSGGVATDECVARLITESSVLDPLLVRASARALVLGRDAWPVGVPIALEPLLGVELVDTRFPRASSAAPTTAESFEGFDAPEDEAWLAPLPEGDYRVLFVWHGSRPPLAFERAFRVRGAIRDYLEPVVPDRAARGFDARLIRLPGTAPDHFQIVLDVPAEPGVAHALRLTLVREGLAAAGERVFVDPSLSTIAIPVAGRGLGQLTTAIRRGDAGELERWSLVIEGDPALALTDPGATRYWAGPVTLTMAHLLRNEGPSSSKGP